MFLNWFKKESDGSNVNIEIQKNLLRYLDIHKAHGSAYESYIRFENVSDSAKKLVNSLTEQNKNDEIIKGSFKELKDSLLSIDSKDFDCFNEDETLEIISMRFEFINSIVNYGLFFEQRMLNQKIVKLTWIIVFLTVIMLILTCLTLAKDSGIELLNFSSNQNLSK